MGINATPVVGKIRVTAALANTLERLIRDGEKARSLAEKLELELMGDDEDEGVDEKKEGDEQAGDGHDTKEGHSGQGKEKSMSGLRERGSMIVQDKTERLLEDAGLVGDLDEEQQLRKVCPS